MYMCTFEIGGKYKSMNCKQGTSNYSVLYMITILPTYNQLEQKVVIAGIADALCKSYVKALSGEEDSSSISFKLYFTYYRLSCLIYLS